MLNFLFIYNKISPEQKKMMFDLWNEGYPAAFHYTSLFDFEKTLTAYQNLRHYTFEGNNGDILGWAFTFDREEARWFGLIVGKKFQNQGIGSALLKKISESEKNINGWVITQEGLLNEKGEPYKTPLNFYLKNGFQKTEEYSTFKGVEMIKINSL